MDREFNSSAFFGKLTLSEKMQLYAYHTHPVLNVQALFTDESSNFVHPMEPQTGDKVTVRFRTAVNNVDQVYFCNGDRKAEMFVAYSDEIFDYYETAFIIGRETINYYFEVHADALTYYFNKKGPSQVLEEFFNYALTPGFAVPEWAKGAVFYQIFVDRFAKGDPSTDVLDREYIYIDRPVQQVKDWNRLPAAMDVGNFYGGDLQGVLDHLDYLKNLGVDVLYLNPIFVSPSNHKYDIQDYFYVDPHFAKIVVDEGETLPDWNQENASASRYISRVTDKRNLEASNEFFVHFVEEVHKRDMKVILDGVFNHCGSFNRWMDAERIYENQPGYEKGAYVSADSPYRQFFKFYTDHGWPYNGDYDGWWGHKTLPKLNYEESEKLCETILEVGRKWVSPPFNCDGWRLDVAADLGQSEEFNHMFWKRFRRTVKDANPDALILAEHYEDPGSWLQGDEWDTVMNYNAFMEPVTWFLTGMEKHSDEKRPDLMANSQAFRDAMIYHMSRFHYPSLQVAMNELSNHDHSRFLTRTNFTVGRTATVGAEAADKDVNPAIMRSAVIIQMTWIGAPTLYYGDEAGLTGWTDPDNRRTYPWGREDQDLLKFHKDMIRMHKHHTALSFGSLKYLPHVKSVIAFGRFTEKEKMVILVNGSFEDEEIKVPVWEVGVTDEEIMRRIVISDAEGYSMHNIEYRVEHGSVNLTVPATGAIVLKAYHNA